MGDIQMFQSQDVSKVTFKPPPPPVQEPEIVKAQDIATTPPPAEDIKQIDTGKGTPSEIAVVTPTVTVAAPPPPKDDWLTQPDKPAEVKPVEPPKTEETKPKKKKKKNFFDKIGDWVKKHEKEIAIGGAIVGGIVAGTTQTEKPKETEKPQDPPKTEKPKEPEKPKTEPKKEEKPIPASGRTFKTQGDPIVKTGDGLQYSMNVPGTYLALQSKSGDFKMEQTVSETPGHRHYNTGMNFHVGKNDIKFDANGGKNPATMTINGEKVDLKFTAFSKTLDDGTKVSYDPKTNKVNITSPEGDNITVHRAWNDQKTHYLNATVELSEKRPAGSVYGALGTLDADDDAKNDARLRDGSVYKGPIGDLWKTPEDFLKEWRVK